MSEDKEIYMKSDVAMQTVKLAEPPMVQLVFHHEQKEVGKLYWNPDDRRMHFEGSLHESARVFIDTLEKMYLQRYPEEPE